MNDTLHPDYSNKPSMYYEHPRTEIQSLLPVFSEKVLDVGCGTGATLAWLKSIGRCSATFGVELFEEAASQAKGKIDHLMIGSIEEDDFAFADERFDLILLLDVLEHLIDPWRVLRKLADCNLRVGGTVVACIPNIRFYGSFVPLVFKGQWEYADTGVLDRTHLRFFTKKSAKLLINGAGLNIEAVLSNPVDFSRKQQLANLITLNAFHDFLTQQYLIQAVKQ